MNRPNTNLQPKLLVEPKQLDYDYTKNIIIILLFIIIVFFTSLGIFANDFLNELLYSTGWFIGKTSDVISKTGEGSLEIANDAIHNGSNLMIKASGKDVSSNKTSGKNDKQTQNKKEPVPDTTTNPIQKPITSTKSNWCLVGEYQGRRGCIEIGDNDKCMSGQIFPSQYTCLNPNFSQNVLPNVTTPNGIPPRKDINQLPINKVPTIEEQEYIQYQISNPNVRMNK
jgi:hypothetical protein